MKQKYRNINLELTNTCTFSCSFCPDGQMTRKKEMLDFGIVKKTIDEIAEMKLAPMINFYVMGEPLVYPKLFEIIEYAKNKGIQPKLNTNGSLLSPEKNNQLLDSGVHELHISYYSSIPELFPMRKCQIKNLSFEQWNSTVLDLLKKRKQRKDLKMDIHVLFFTFPHLLKILSNRINKKEFKDKYKKSLFDIFKYLEINPNKKLIKYIINGKRLQKYLTFFKISDGLYFDIIKFHCWGNINKKKVYRAWFGSCEAFRETCAILSNGGVSLCCADYNGELVVGNLYEEKLKDILESPGVQSIIRSFEKNNLPFDKCKICRGGPNIFLWLRNQVSSVVHYNLKRKAGKK